MEEVRKLERETGVTINVADQCMYGLTTPGEEGGEPTAARKRTKFMTNSFWLALELKTKCDGRHEHQWLMGGRAKAAAMYPTGLCRAICRGLRNELDQHKPKLKCLMSVTAKDKVHVEGPTLEQKRRSQSVEHEEDDDTEIRQAWDDVSGKELDGRMVAKARMQELGYVKDKKVWVKITRKEAIRRGMKIIKTRWIDINKGDVEDPNYRSRFVAKEFNVDKQEGLFAATPPLEALKMLIGEAATMDWEGEDKVVMINDVARAFFEAPMQRDMCVELPEEDREEGEGDMVAYLQQSLYGTRDAAANFQREVRKVMREAGFEVGKYNVSTYYHARRQLRTLVHGDDFVTVGSREDVKWFRERLDQRFQLKTSVVGRGQGEVKETRILNRVLRVTQEGWEYEADQRHGELIIQTLAMEGAKTVVSPGEDAKAWGEEQDQEKLGPEKASEYRGLAARANYLALDRPDIQYAVKEICRGMSSPTIGDRNKMKRLARYLVGMPRVVSHFRNQYRADCIMGYSDSDWAGCKKTSRSTSGGAVMVGGALHEDMEHDSKVGDPEQWGS